MSQWLAEVIDNSVSRDDAFSAVRQASLEALKTRKWPNRRTEEWQFTPLMSVEKRSLALAATPTKDIQVPVVPGLNSLDIVFVDGELITDISALQTEAGMTISSFDTLDDDTQNRMQSLFGKVKPANHLFGLVNDVLAGQGIFIDVDAGATIEQPVRIVNLATQNADNHTRVLVNLGANASATIIEHGQGTVSSMNTAFAEYVVGEQAALEHYRFALFTEQAVQVGGSHFELHSKATMNSNFVGFGSQLSRLDVDVHHAGEHAFAKMNAVYLLAEGELFDLHTTIEHTVPNGTTEENARGIIGDGARAVFNGRIHIHRDAQKTLAELNNRNLLLSRRGVVNTKPELEIYADDVRCAHGATVAEIDDEALYYLLSRGISRSQALVMLNFGFINELISDMPNEHIANWLQPQLSDRFAAMEVK